MKSDKAVKLDVVILGGGFAGVYCARAATRALSDKQVVGIVSNNNYMVFQPMLPEVAGSSISPRHVVNPLRLLCRDARVLCGTVESIDWPNRSLILNAGRFSGNLRISFEELVVALGAVTDLSRIPGMPEHAFLIQNVGDAMHLRATILGRLEEANLEPQAEIKRRLTSFVVVGGGYSGVETAGHILDLFHSIGGYYPSIAASDLSVYLVHHGDHLLPTLSRKLGEYSADKLREAGLKLVLNQLVKSVTANRVYLDNGDTIETNTVICTVGNAPHPLVTKLCQECGLETDKGRLVTEATGQVKGQTQLWAAGDCAAFPLVSGGLCPQTAQFAYRQGLLVGRNLARRRAGQALRAFTFKGIGELASIGHRKAVAEIYGMHFSGFLAWWLWRSIYLLKLPRLDRKVRVMLDWTLDLFFPRDLNHLSPRFTRPIKEIYLEAGDLLFQQSEPAFSFYMIKSGTIELRDGDELVQRIGAGGFFGEQALLEDGIWHYTARAVESTRLVSVPAAIFHELIRGVGSLGAFFRKSATKYRSREMLDAIGRKVPPERTHQPVSQLMERRLFTLRPDMTLQEALRVIRDHPRSSYPVLDTGNHLCGTLTRDEFYELLKCEQTQPSMRIRDIRLAELPTVSGETTVIDVMRCFVRSGSNKVLIVDRENHVEGIATVVDLLAATGDSDGSEEQRAAA